MNGGLRQARPRPDLTFWLVVLFMASCRGSQRKAVEQSIQDHLKGNPHLVTGSYNTRIERVTFNGDSADARVRFESKQSAGLFVEVDYGLHLENGRWEVVSSTPVPGQDSHRPREDNVPMPQGTQPGSPPQPSH